jgi:TM2 domain-containing membrane protein YozV
MRDLRRFAEQTNRRLILGGIALLFIVGDGLVYIFYGKEAALTGLVCLIFGLSPLLLIWLSLAVITWIVRRADGGDQ